MEEIAKKVRHWAIDHGWTVDHVVLDMNDEQHEGWIWTSPDGRSKMWSLGYCKSAPTVPPGLILQWEHAHKKRSEQEKQEIKIDSVAKRITIPPKFLKNIFGSNK